jgi:hypothetical protein
MSRNFDGWHTHIGFADRHLMITECMQVMDPGLKTGACRNPSAGVQAPPFSDRNMSRLGPKGLRWGRIQP